ncbi:hypothetical protein [Allocoleopsis franciscana]|uniref:Uncharacterized protein n=1 Tax=Allocoleopsis franciscana PCC 7113 TaxID=1173027 RepID=K9W940_9CYAN|nr:hypothetical protein [Allocoleopsis franciscana]AFZ16743.1 hypothetical protein Mic7113_0836 [Allocoleopsis franciscana PCC 7113]
MVEGSSIKVTINFNDPDLSPEDQEIEVQKLLKQLKELDELESVERILDPNPPEGNKALGGFLMGMLTTEVNPANVRNLIGFLGDRLSGKAIEMEVEANGKKLKVKASSQAELMAAIEAAQKFVTM